MSRLASSDQCRLCGTDAYTADEEGPVHACCAAWREVIEAGGRCPSCQAGAWLRSPEHAGRTMPPLPRFLPDGRPFRPDLASAEVVHQAVAPVTELETRRVSGRLVQREREAG